MNLIASRNSMNKTDSTTRKPKAAKTGGSRENQMGDMTLIDKWEWTNKCSKANLVDVYRLHCGKFPLHLGQKSQLRNIFVSGSLQDIRDNFQTLMSYCAEDVSATWKLFRHLYPQYRYHNPHSVTFAGSILMGNSRLPADSLWKQYKQVCNEAADDMINCLEGKLKDVALIVAFNTSEESKKNIWLRQLDWSLVDLTLKKNKEALMVSLILIEINSGRLG